jgi:hypothetical protein
VRARVAAIALAAIACTPSPMWRGRGPSRGALVTVTEDDHRLVLDVDGGARRTYDAIAFDRLAWTPRGVLVPAQRDGSWWLVDGTIERGPFVEIGEVVTAGDHDAVVVHDTDGWHVLRDGAAGAAFDAIEEGVLLDADHGSVAYVVRRGDGEHVVHDDAIGPAVALVALPVLGAKGRMLAYVDRGARDRLLVDQVEVATYDGVLELAVAADEPHWAALVADGDRTTLVHDAAARASATYLTHLRISDDGAHVACLAPAEDGSAIDVIVDGAHVAHHRRVDGERLAFVPGDGRVAFVLEDAQGMQVRIGDVESERYDELEGPVLARDRAGFVGRRQDHSEVVIDGATIATEEWAGTLSLAAHGGGYAYVARAGGERFVVTSRGRWPVPRLFVDTLVLDEDGRHWAALVPEMATRSLEVWVDGVPHATLDDRELGGAIAIERETTLRTVVRRYVEGELARAVDEMEGAD